MTNSNINFEVFHCALLTVRFFYSAQFTAQNPYRITSADNNFCWHSSGAGKFALDILKLPDNYFLVDNSFLNFFLTSNILYVVSLSLWCAWLLSLALSFREIVWTLTASSRTSIFPPVPFSNCSSLSNSSNRLTPCGLVSKRAQNLRDQDFCKQMDWDVNS